MKQLNCPEKSNLILLTEAIFRIYSFLLHFSQIHIQVYQTNSLAIKFHRDIRKTNSPDFTSSHKFGLWEVM